jgi:hypothetical protein
VRRVFKATAWFGGLLVTLPIAVYVVALIVNWRDREPSPAAIRFAQLYRGRPAVTDENNAFVYLMGFSAAIASYACRVADIEGIRRAALTAVRLRAAHVEPSDVAAALATSELRNAYDDSPFFWDEKSNAIVFQGLEAGERGAHRIYY